MRMALGRAFSARVLAVAASAVVSVPLSACASQSGPAPSESVGTTEVESSISAPPATTAPPNAAEGVTPTVDPAQTDALSGQVAAVDEADTAPVPGTDPAAPSRDVLQQLTVDPASGPVPDACDLLAPAEPLLPAGVVRTSENRTSAEFAMSLCVWGAPDSDAMLWLYVVQPGTVADPAAFFIPQQAPPSNPAPQPPGGRVWEAGFFGFGGTTVEGRTYGWSVGTDQVIMTYLGEVTPARGQALDQAAREVDQRLG